jgi:hypothetical protein
MRIKGRKVEGSTTFHIVTHAVVVVSAANVTWKTFVRIKYQQNI